MAPRPICLYLHNHGVFLMNFGTAAKFRGKLQTLPTREWNMELLAFNYEWSYQADIKRSQQELRRDRLKEGPRLQSLKKAAGKHTWTVPRCMGGWAGTSQRSQECPSAQQGCFTAHGQPSVYLLTLNIVVARVARQTDTVAFYSKCVGRLLE